MTNNKKPSSDLVYIFECIVCGRRFKKSMMDIILKPHKDKKGNMCFSGGKFVGVEPKVKP